MITRALLTTVVACSLLLAPPAARAEVAGAGDFIADFTGSTTSGAISGRVDFAPADPDFVVAGQPVDLEGYFPNGGTTIGAMLGGLFSYDIDASSSSGAFLTIRSIDGQFQSCTSAGCAPPELTLVGYPAFMNWSQGVLPNASRLYVVDVTVPVEPGAGEVEGAFGINAFPIYATSPAGAFIDTGVDLFFDSVKGRVVPYQATVQYDGFPDFGTTTIVPVSAANGALPPDVALNQGGVESVFVDVDRLTPRFARNAQLADQPSVTVCLAVNPGGEAPTVALDQLRLLHRSSPDGAFVDTGAELALDPTRLCATVDALSPFVIGVDTTAATTTTTSVPETTTTTSTSSSTSTSTSTSTSSSTSSSTSTSSTTSTVESTTSTSTSTSTSSTTSSSTSSSTATTETTTSTSTSSTSTSSSSTTSSSTSSSSTSSSSTTSSSTTSTVPGCTDAATFASILCRLDVLTGLTEEGDIDARLQQTLLERLAKARAVVLEAEERADAGIDRGAMSRLKSAERRVRGYVQRVSSLAGRRGMEPGLSAVLTDHAEAIEADIKTLRQTF